MRPSPSFVSLIQTPDIPSRHVFEALCRDAAHNLNIDLVSVWLFDPNRTRLVCMACLDVVTNKVTVGIELLRTKFPKYFQHLIEETVIRAPRVQEHSWTRELIEDYFKPLGVQSLLDFILHDGETPIGVICCENRAAIREWTEADIVYVRKLTALASLHFLRGSAALAA